MRHVAIPAIAAALLFAGPALAQGQSAQQDRPPTPEERTAIEEALRGHGYVSWDEIELDDGRWEVDDATTADGTQYDLELDPSSLEVVRKDRD